MKIKEKGVYFVNGSNLGMKDDHYVIVNKKVNNGLYQVFTITSLEDFDNKSKKFIFRERRFDDVKYGKIIPVPINKMNSKKFSGINVGKPILVFEKDIHKTKSGIILPKKYKGLL